jgi:hypothetical protein
MGVRRTARVKLIVPDEHRDDLHETAEQFLNCANRAAEFCWDDASYPNCITANSTARDALYTELREGPTSPPTSSKRPFDAPCKRRKAASNGGSRASE